LLIANGKLFLPVDDGLTGIELWALDVDANQAPVADAGPDQTVPIGTPVTLDGSASFDPEGGPLSYEWRDGAGDVIGTTAVIVVGPLPEGTHTFTLTVSDGDLTDSDSVDVVVLGPPAISIADVAVVEGNEGPTQAAFVVSLSHASAQTVSVRFGTVPGTARPPRDYRTVTGRLTFPPGTTSAPIVVKVVGETLCEPDEVFLVRLAEPANATLADAVAIGTILDDDCP
jgi:hypothetical protein